MDPFRQTVVNTPGIPRTLQPSLFKSVDDLSSAVDGSLARYRDTPPILGISVLLTAEEGLLEAVAFATSDDIFVLYLTPTVKHSAGKKTSPGANGFSSLLYGQKASLVGLGMARLSLHIRKGLNTHVRGIELAEVVQTTGRSPSPGLLVRDNVDPSADILTVNTIWDSLPSDLKDDPRRLEHLCMRAWLSARIAIQPRIYWTLKSFSLVDTVWLTSKYFKPIHQMLVEVEQMEAAKPRILENEFSSVERLADGMLVINNERYKNRVRPSDTTAVHLVDEDGRVYYGDAKGMYGKQTRVKLRNDTGGGTIKRIRVVGREELGHPDRARDLFLLRLLQGKLILHDPAYELLQKLYFPNSGDASVQKCSGAVTHGRLNQSQADVVEAMVNSETPLVVVHGPPGTGKTSTISAALKAWVQIRSTAWVVAQSNVGVKNIAERLYKDDVKFRLIVSKEFYDEWHEHIYEEGVKTSLIRTDELPSTIRENAVVFNDVRVVLCTISTLSNPSINQKNIFSIVPMINLVVDEASQIGIFNYMHVLAQSKRLRKVCFFGDPKQLPPYGKDLAPTSQCIFDLKHLKPQAYFLNTQYRLPVPLGNFISNMVYDNKLRSEHRIKSSSCIAFVDVALGEEKERGKSFVNAREIQTVIHLVEYYYRQKNYSIITPYDAQRSEIEKSLKERGLRWDNVYNVDSFQGNESDFIIISVVRSVAPGFLVSQNRVNVMLSRCRSGMVVVTSRSFMQLRRVKETLIGQLCQHWEQIYDSDRTWRDSKSIAEAKANLPGALRKRVEQVAHHDISYSPSQSPSVSQSHAWSHQSSMMSNMESTSSSDLSSLSRGLRRHMPALTGYPNPSPASGIQKTRQGPAPTMNRFLPRVTPVDFSRPLGDVRPQPLIDDSNNSYNSLFPGLPSPPKRPTMSKSRWAKGPPSLVSQGLSHADSSASSWKPSNISLKGERVPSSSTSSSKQESIRRWGLALPS